MNALLRIPYDFAWRVANGLAPLIPRSENKVLRTVRARKNLLLGIDAWAGAHRDLSRPLVWIHAASVGESLQALPLLRLLKERRRDVQLVFTFYSPSAEKTARQFPADFTTFLPFDSARSMRHVIRSFAPSALIFSKLDVWPTLVEEAKRAGIPTGIISATVRSGSGRTSAFASLLLRDTYAAIDAIGAISEADKLALIDLGASPDHIEITGDTRYDQVWIRRESGGPAELLNRLRSNQPTLVAGSTWASDEPHLLDAFVKIRKTGQQLRLIIAPHEPSDSVIENLRAWAVRNEFSHALLDDPRAASADLVIVDRTGVLGDLYAIADIAYVGGGFQRAGLHSVIEPAAFGKPVIFGAPFGKMRDAELLIVAGGAYAVCNSQEIRAALSSWLSDSTSRSAAGAAAESLVKNGLGAALASFRLVDGLLDPDHVHCANSGCP